MPRIKFFLAGAAITVAAAVAMLSACTGKESRPSDAAKTPFELNIMTISFEDEQPRNNNPVGLAIERYTGTNLDINFIPSAGYDEKSKVVLLSNNLPQVILGTDPKNPHFVSAIQNGIFWDLTDYIQDYANLANINPAVYKNSSINGRIYGLPRERPLVRSGFVYRKDWLDNLGLPEPGTIEDFYNMLRRFTHDDPDRNGKQDTYGISESKNIHEGLLFNLLAWYGAPHHYAVRDGKLEPDFYSDAYLEALKFIRRIYEEKLIVQDFAAQQDNESLLQFEKGKVGVLVGTLSAGNNFKELRDEDKLGINSYLVGKHGPRTFSHPGFFGIYMIPKSAVETEEELRQILSFFDRLGDREMQNLFKWGIPGIHSVIVNGQFRQKEAGEKTEEDERALSELSAMGGLDIHNKAGADPGLTTGMNRRIAELERSTLPFIVEDPSAPLISQTASEKGEQLNQIIHDADIRFIMGVLDEDGWRSALQTWSDSGGAKVTEEFTAAYQKLYNSGARE